jgi:hypothetical protein
MPKIVIPVAKKIFVCDDVIIDPVSRKASALNLWDTVRVRNHDFPFSLDKVCVFALFRGGLGEIPIHIEIARADSGDVLRRSAELILEFRDRTKRYDARVMLEGIVFPCPGTYIVELYCNHVFVDDQPIRVVSDPL